MLRKMIFLCFHVLSQEVFLSPFTFLTNYTHILYVVFGSQEILRKKNNVKKNDFLMFPCSNEKF